MPGELAKPAVIIFVAALLSGDASRIRNYKIIFLLLAIALAMFGLIYKQPNLSTAGTVIVIILVMMFIAGMNIMSFLSIMESAWQAWQA